MSKQIYIDSNGNEVLVSGTITNDNNLPHYTGTPTAGSTAEAIGAKQDKITVLTNQTATTNANGGINLGLSSNNVTVLSVNLSSTNGDKCAIPVLAGTNYWITVRNTSDFTKVASESVTYEVVYISK